MNYSLTHEDREIALTKVSDTRYLTEDGNVVWYSTKDAQWILVEKMEWSKESGYKLRFMPVEQYLIQETEHPT